MHTIYSLRIIIVEIQQGWKQIGIFSKFSNIPICFQPCWISTIIIHNDSKAYNIYDSIYIFEKYHD